MKKTAKIFISLLVTAVIFVSGLMIPASAAGNTVISFSKSSVTVGDTVTVTVSVSVSAIYSTEITVNYDENVLSYVSGASDGGAGVLRIVEAYSGENKITVPLTFKAAKAGSAKISVSGKVGAGIPAEDVGLSGASATMTVKDVSLSSNANLKSLSVSSGSLSPRFSASTTSYTVEVKKSVTNCSIYATAAESGAKVSVSGSSALQIGANKRTVTVTAPSGAQKVYTITINRSNVDEPVSSEVSDGDTNPLETIIGGISYEVMADISGADLPNGFSVTKKLYNGQDISVATDKEKNYELFYLKSSTGTEYIPYTYDEQANVFQRVLIIIQGENRYIVSDIPEGFTVPEGFYLTDAVINDLEMKCYASDDEKLADMYYLYCYFDGKYGMYRYDNVEKVLQRNPEFELLGTGVAETIAAGGVGNFLNRFKSLSTNAKTIVVCLILVCIGIVAMIVLLIVKFVSSRNHGDYDMKEDTGDFDSIRFNDDFEITDNTDAEDNNDSKEN